MKNSLPALALLILSTAGCSDSPTAPDPSADSRVQAAGPSAAKPDKPPKGFIITLADGVDPATVAREHKIPLKHLYTRALKGFAGTMSEAARSGLLRDRRVLAIEPDGIMKIAGTESNAPWGLDRLDQRSKALNHTFTYHNTGSGVRVYIIDTGIRFNHAQFGGRAVSGFDAVDGGSASDCNGHGTHVAGTVGGTKYGVAKAATLVGVRVLKCSGLGNASDIIAGIDWVAQHAVRPAVANLSLTGLASNAVDAAVRGMIAAGVATAVAAGNDNVLACDFSPARVTAAMTIGATTRTDSRASFSNRGACIDWFAPGVDITSAWFSGTTAIRTMSGTSQASPHVAGVAALYLQSNRRASPQQVRTALFNKTTKNIVGNARSANNHLLFTNY
jgi:subtilisin family serine protease